MFYSDVLSALLLVPPCVEGGWREREEHVLYSTDGLLEESPSSGGGRGQEQE